MNNRLTQPTIAGISVNSDVSRSTSGLRKMLVLLAFVCSSLTISSVGQAQTASPCPSPSSFTLTAPSMPTIYPGDFTQLTAAQISNRAGLNDHSHNKFFLCTFKWDKRKCCEITKAVLTVKMYSNQNGTGHTSSDAGNDRIGLVHNGVGIGLPASTWVYPATSFPINTPSTISWNITGPALTQLKADGRLSFAVEDDTRVESATLVINECCVTE